MFSSFRLSMSWLHTWLGLVLGYLLIVIFFFGSLSVFDREFDRWALPETRFAAQTMPSYDSMLAPIFAQMKPAADELEAAGGRVKSPLPTELKPLNWAAYTTHRDPVVGLYAEYAVPGNPNDADDHVHGHVTVDPRNGRVLRDDQLKIGSEFFYPMHISLHIGWRNLGYWIVGLAALVMLAALVSGVVIHRRLFREFFTFRPKKHVQRSTLDLHNLTGVVALPFHFFFALTGLTIFAGIYLPVSETLLKPQATAAAIAEAQAKNLPYAASGVPASIASVDAMVIEAKRRWASHGMAGEVGYLYISHPGDKNSYVTVYRGGSDRVALLGQAIHFEGATGRVLFEEPQPSTVAKINEFLTGLHLQQFEHWALRWFYLFGGMAGCVCIVTGFLFFVEKRKRAQPGHARCADAMAVTTVTGMLIAVLAVLVANQLLPQDLTLRGEWEKRAFWASWLLSFVHAAWRSKPLRPVQPSPAWFEQCCAIAVLAFAALMLNSITTGDHLLKTVFIEHYWPVAGVDIALLAVGLLATATARRLRLRWPALQPGASQRSAAAEEGHAF
ncbi:PepSY-associated TM helix domain-containing protein [Roseateles koreensis]|uniref:PepSY-associated TM helix domain-containing protein n=1 Tax=Roseateles koreensis TaxID=2987526 RepID=A0ABT5KLN3_9BURK|nr:PepSY-associated TM helix domain-containing protein [Roseateles koreensis]MDC8783828.1 PepSY-associated TM helix domain-containing protein [Roseateles koreensis]